ncbi:cell division protein ZipA C-terminal FtsZ-binding domain-containing protein [Methylophilaceae bacterium]|nr:cell division protein ZipA C-terminal FtsZ-binding domain-containing protein [Methylophilaceae bacterium]
MSDVQLALLILGLFIIIIMIIYNWAQISSHKKRKEKLNATSSTISEDNDPLFQSAEFEINDSILSNERSNTEGSAKIISENLPDGIFPEVESVASITFVNIQNSLQPLFYDKALGINGLRIYVRNDNDIWATGQALEEGLRYNQILIVQQLVSRKGKLEQESVNSLIEYVNEVKTAVNGALFWLFNEEIGVESKRLNDMCREVDRALTLKVLPKSDTAFHPAALIDFFKSSSINRSGNEAHRLLNPKNENESICDIVNLSGKPLEINQEAFVQGIIFKMDVPNTKNITHAFNEMIKIIREACSQLNGTLVDVGGKPMNDDYISKVYVYLKGVEQKMLVKKIIPGSELAKKIFS